MKKALKQIVQVLAALVYTPLYTGIMYCAIVLPLAWVMTRSTKVMILILIFLGGIIEGIITLLQAFGLMPFHWITKGHRGAFYISISLCVILPALHVYLLWSSLLHQGTLAIVMAVVFSLMLLQFMWGSIAGLLTMSDDE